MEQNFLIKNSRGMCLWLFICMPHISREIVKKLPQTAISNELALCMKIIHYYVIASN